jgi:hypothetical protein
MVRTKIRPVFRGPKDTDGVKGMRSTGWMAKGVVRHWGQVSAPGRIPFAFGWRYEVVVLMMIFEMISLMRPRIVGMVKDSVVT